MIDAMVRKLDEMNQRLMYTDDIREILLAGKEEQPKEQMVFDKTMIAVTDRLEELERRVAEQDEHIHDLEKIIRDGEVFDQINEVIRKIHNRVCDLEGYGQDKSPVVGVDEPCSCSPISSCGKPSPAVDNRLHPDFREFLPSAPSEKTIQISRECADDFCRTEDPYYILIELRKALEAQ